MNVPDYVENEDAYVNAIARNIARNARKTVAKRCAADPSIARIYDLVMDKGEIGSSAFFKSLYEAFNKYGKLTPGQEAAVTKIIATDAERKAAMRAADAGSVFVGKIGERREFTLTLTGRADMESDYGFSYLHFFKDANGNVVIYKGTKRLHVEKGASITFKATIKAHNERDGIQQTILTRPKES